MDECAVQIDNCTKSRSTCQNTLGTYMCECLPGFYGLHCQYGMQLVRIQHGVHCNVDRLFYR